MTGPADGEREARLYAGRLEIVSEPGTLEAHAYCPYRKEMLRAGECFACADCGGLAMDGSGKHSYVVCDRAERDGLATSAWYEEREVGLDGPMVSVALVRNARRYEPER
jgi:hypothetical protein